MPEVDVFRGLPIVGGHPAVDFVNTILYSIGQDYLASYRGLVDWAAHQGIIDEAESAELMALDERSAKAEAALAAARSLREVLKALILAAIDKSPAPAETAESFRRFYADAMTNAALEWRGELVAYALKIGSNDPRIIVWRLTKLAADLLTMDHQGRLRACVRRPDCHWVFLDTSKGGGRRWCLPGVCGNIHRLKTFRQKHAAVPQ
jgi:predicted RNA-binding Zn ribbon-like protein